MTTPNTNYRRDQIPLWIYLLSGLLALILAFQSYSAYFDPSLAYGTLGLDTDANKQVMSTLGGRNVVMLLLTLMAMKSGNSMLLAFTFIMHLAREGQDMFIVPYYAGFTTIQGIMTFCSFLFIFVIPELLALLKLKKIAAMP